jgi:hypothetical protein
MLGFNPNKHSQSAQNETERKISLNSANSSRSATPVPSDKSGKEVRLVNCDKVLGDFGTF